MIFFVLFLSSCRLYICIYVSCNTEFSSIHETAILKQENPRILPLENPPNVSSCFCVQLEAGVREAGAGEDGDAATLCYGNIIS